MKAISNMMRGDSDDVTCRHDNQLRTVEQHPIDESAAATDAAVDWMTSWVVSRRPVYDDALVFWAARVFTRY